MVVLNNILFLDIETVPQHPSFSEVADEWKELWAKKAEVLLRNREDETVETIYHRAGIYAEFGKIVCISCGIIQGGGSSKRLVLKSFCGDDEKQLLLHFCDMLKKWATNDG